MKTRSMTLLGIVLGATVVSVAVADGKDDRHGPAFLHRPADAGHGSAAGSASASASAAHEGDAKADNDEDQGTGPDEKPENKDKRRSYIRATKNKLTDAVQAGGKAVTDEERDVIRTHWRHTMRLWRIRNLAMVDGDKAVVTKVDALLAQEDGKTTAKLKELNAKAPAGTAAAPAGGAK
ncbi:MAG TPA: hypothetical protein VF316_05325 [Polyangiaceae bacterium]